MRDENGALVPDRLTAAVLWCRYVQDLFKAKLADDIDALPRGALFDQRSTCENGENTSSSLSVPSLRKFESAMMKLRGDGALGLDDLPGSVLQVEGARSAALIMRILLLVFASHMYH